MGDMSNMRTVHATVETPERGTLRTSPVAGWGIGNRSEVTVQPDGEVPGIEQMQEMLHGKNNRRYPCVFTFHVDYRKPGQFTARTTYASKNGAKLALSVDNIVAAQYEYPPARRETKATAVLVAQVPAGKHDVKLANTGKDWALVDGIELSDYAPALGAVGKSNGDYAVFWVYHRPDPSPTASGTLVAPGLAEGSYTATWWNTYEGKPLGKAQVEVKAGQPLRLATPPVARDVAVWITRAE